jgi:membrane protein implicated in regulation of membrane protease activity
MMERDKKLKLMRFWIFGTFVIIWASALIYIGTVVGTGMMIFGELNFWLAFVGSAFLSVLSYYIYQKYTERMEN